MHRRHPCQATTTLMAGRTTIAKTKPQTLGAGELGYLSFSLTRAGHTLLAKTKTNQLGVTATVTTPAPAGSTTPRHRPAGGTPASGTPGDAGSAGRRPSAARRSGSAPSRSLGARPPPPRPAWRSSPSSRRGDPPQAAVALARHRGRGSRERPGGLQRVRA